MQLRTFSANSTSAVLLQIREELGPDAVILDTSEKDGVVTITAARERQQADEYKGPPTPVQSAVQVPASPVSEPRPRAGFGLSAGFSPFGALSWQEEWSFIKSQLLTLMKPALKLDELPPRQRLALEFLQREGVNDQSLLSLFARLAKNPEGSILESLGALVPVQSLEIGSWPERTHIFAGPFGSGKTSAAIRMALSLRRETPGIRICLVNADATRGSGRLILRHYAELSDFAYKEAANSLELAAALTSAEKEGYERVIVDLPGLVRGGRLADLLDRAGLESGKGRRALDIAVHLVISPQYGEAHISGMLERYRSGFAGSIIWTKLDEAEHYGQIVNVGMATGLPVSALSFGPGLGNSLSPATASMLWRLLFKKELPGAS